VLLATISASGAIAQNSIEIRALEGTSGKPLASQRLVIFGGKSAKGAILGQEVFDVTTDERGVAKFQFDSARTGWIQVWVDGMTLCQTKPNANNFSLETILVTGLSAPNSCSSFVQAAAAGHFSVYARRSSFRERMVR
jgi:hypothetical protein